MKANDNFTKKIKALYAQLREVGDEARRIITDFARSHGGMYTVDTEDCDLIWVGEDIYATAVEIDANGNVLVHNSARYSEYLHDMSDYNVLDLANAIHNL